MTTIEQELREDIAALQARVDAYNRQDAEGLLGPMLARYRRRQLQVDCDRLEIRVRRFYGK